MVVEGWGAGVCPSPKIVLSRQFATVVVIVGWNSANSVFSCVDVRMTLSVPGFADVDLVQFPGAGYDVEAVCLYLSCEECC